MNEIKKVEMYLEVGNDIGNSEHDVVINGYLIQQPNIMSKIRKLPLLDEINSNFVCEKIHSNLITSINSPAVATGTYFAGSYALNSGSRIRDIEVGVDNDKVNSDVVAVNTLSQIAGYGVGQAFKDGEDIGNIELHIRVDMTTGLPVTQYSKEMAQRLINKFIENKHNVTVHVGNININTYIVFESVRVLPESVPAIFALQNARLEKGEREPETDNEQVNLIAKELFQDFNNMYGDKDTPIDGEYFTNKRILHVGIGEGTTEYPLTKDIVFNPNFIIGSNNGIGHAIDRTLPEFMKKLGLLSYSRQKYSEVMRDKAHKYHDIAMDMVEEYIEEESEDVFRFIRTEIERANNEVDIIMIYGGGSILMREHLEDKVKLICKRANIQLFYVPEKYAVTLESIGMYEFTKGKIFKKLKENQANSK